MKLGVPRFGIYSNVMKSFLEGLGIEVIMPAKITRDIIKLGVANSAAMVCFPFKTTLGQEIWALENGATDLLMFNSCGLCRLKHYYQIQEHTLRNIGYQFDMNVITKQNLKKEVKRLLNISFLEAHKLFKKVYSDIQELEDATYGILPERDLNIGIVGEVYTCWESDTNFDIVRKLQRMGVNVHMSITVTDYLGQKTYRGKEEEKEARKLLSQELGGHGFESIVNTIYYGKNGYDGVIHLMPLSCAPESTVEPLVDMMAEKYHIPLYRFNLDESNFEQGFVTRLETFVSMLRRRQSARNR